MKLKLNHLIILLLFLFTSTIISAQSKTILIIAEAKTLPDDSQVYIAGNTDHLGNWNEMLPMEKLTDHRWSFETTAETGDTLEFKFTLGGWMTEAVDSAGMEYPNFVHVVTEDATLEYSLPGWRGLVKRKIVLSPERLKNKAGQIDLYEDWKYKIGDDTAWAAPSFDDSNWEMINPFLNKEDFEKLDWTGNIWFRNYILVDSSLWGQPFGFVFSCTGAAEIYLDGKLLYKYGKVGDSKESEVTYLGRTPRHIVFKENGTHVIAVRYSNFVAEEIVRYDVPVGFFAVIGKLDMFISSRIEYVRRASIIQMAFSAFLLAFAIMHLLLFVFYPKAKENLLYSISMLSFAIGIYTDRQGNFVHSILTAIDIAIINSIAVQTAILFGLLTVYASTYFKIPRYSLIFITVSTLFVLHTIILPIGRNEYIQYAFYIYAIILSLEILRVVIRSLIRKEAWGWGWMIGVGFIVALFFFTYQILIITEVVRPLFGIFLVYVYGLVFLAITVSINLSKKVSDTNKDLEKQLVQVKELSQKTIEQERKAKDEELARKLLEADNERKTKELEEARKLQLSMLPSEVPTVKNLDIAAYMKPATEVGGDYYDFKYNSNGTLTVAVGDATGHGMKAGTMVATIKGLFSAEAAETNIVPFFNKCNSIIRDMNLGNLYMAMLLAKIEDSKLIFSSAGMPPVFIYREKKGYVEELRLQAMPLGGIKDFEYAEKETTLSTGDTLLLMSDGFPELFNKQKEILDYERAKEIFGNAATQPSKKIIDELCNAADDWQAGTHQQDDITFVVMKVK
ncbi:MAG: SpoIIE family protein phosphatase [Ignavibacterium sp.]|nr:MAG: SpoIIE family protein phosphatase [Ignavibacterium sp.]